MVTRVKRIDQFVDVGLACSTFVFFVVVEIEPLWIWIVFGYIEMSKHISNIIIIINCNYFVGNCYYRTRKERKRG